MNNSTNKPMDIYLPVSFHLIYKISLNKNITWSDLSRKLEITISYTLAHRDLFLKHGLITVDKIGRRSLINLTLKGKKLSESINIISLLFGGMDKILPSICRKNGKDIN